MADREPRRRKKRKDSAKKDEHHNDEASAMPFHKVEPRDSDQDVEDDFPPPPSHQPSQLAQIVFTIFFLALAGLMASVFIALHGSNSHLQNFNGGEEEHADIQPPSDLETDTADLHEKEDEHEEELIDILEKFQELAKDFTSDTKEKILEESHEEEEEEDEKDIVYSEPIDIQSATEDHLENSILPSEDITNNLGIDDTSDLPDDNDDDDELDSDGGPVVDEMVSEPIEPTTEIPITSTLESSVDERTTVGETIPDDEMATDDVDDDNEELEMPLEIEEREGVKTDEYENADITNEADYAIKDELDDIDKIIDKNDLLDDDEDTDEEEDEDDDIEQEDEFDFWQF